MCTPEYGPHWFRGGGPFVIDPAFPANGYFTDLDSGWSRDGVPLVLGEDVALSAQLGYPAFRPAPPLRAGEELTYWDEYCEPACSYCESHCADYRAAIVEPDLATPTRPELTLHTLLVRDPSDGGAFGCGDSDYLEIVITVSDDRAAIDELGLIAYLAPTPEEVAGLTVPTAVFGFDYDATGTTATSSIALGAASGHVRANDQPFMSPDPFCFALSAFDRAGNVSERSLPVCVDTNDPGDPSVIWVEGSACGCQADAGSDLGTVLLFALVAAVLRGTGRARCPGTR